MGKLTNTRMAVTIALATSLLFIAGCTAQNSQESPLKTPNTSSATPSQPSSPIDLTKTPPDISGSAKAIIRLADKTGSEEVTVIESIKAGTVSVATECTGEGKTTIVIGKLTTYTIPCATEPSTTYNEIGLGSSKKHVKITVTASAGIHWGLSVGWRPGIENPS
ncbi:hypothetical protein [Streptomyces sp. NPDC096013]|uniref:hypothetical protein n=1 Tax=Streptomyces sp. NPDC096013 TaxID=3366069 RepID=UPI00382BDD99